MNAMAEEVVETMPEIDGTFYLCLSRAQAAFQPIRRDKTVTVRTKAGGTYSFSYAPLEAILRATLPALNAEGFALVQHVEGDYLVTTLYHAAGRLSGSIKIIVTEAGSQAYGSALTYARRYGVTLLLGICADDDDDANAADGNEVTHTNESGGITHPAYVLTPERRERYLPPMVKALESGDVKGFKQYQGELNEGEWKAMWGFLSMKQKTIARDFLQGKNGG